MTIRPLDKQFEADKVNEIKKIREEYENLRIYLKGESAGYMISGINRCLETGILIGALSLSFSFLDMFVHDMVVLHNKEIASDGNNHEDAPPKLFTGQNELPFEKNIQQFMHDGLIDEKDGKELLLIYRKIEIPLHHILSRHTGRYSKTLVLGGDNLLDRFLTRNIGDIHMVEEMIEDYATQCLKIIVTFIQKYQSAFDTYN